MRTFLIFSCATLFIGCVGERKISNSGNGQFKGVVEHITVMEKAKVGEQNLVDLSRINRAIGEEGVDGLIGFLVVNVDFDGPAEYSVPFPIGSVAELEKWLELVGKTVWIEPIYPGSEYCILVRTSLLSP